MVRKITALRNKRGGGKRVNIFLDGKLAFSLEAEVAAKEGLSLEQVLPDERVEALLRLDNIRRGLNAALHYLGYRPRSESELRDRLRRRGFDVDTIGAVITRLREQKLIDDVAFAQFWAENRESFSPRSQWLTGLELRQKGIPSDIIEQVVNVVDDQDNAYRAALSKALNLPRTDYESFRRRLGSYLRRRGFSYEVISHTVGRLWQEGVALKVEGSQDEVFIA